MTEQATAADTANAEMRRYWNEVAGPRWVGRAEIQEARNIEVAQLLLAEARAAPGERVLDVGCGPGATALPLAAAVGPSGHVTGIDISEPMLAVCAGASPSGARQRHDAARRCAGAPPAAGNRSTW